MSNSAMPMPSALCRAFANTLGGTAQVINGVCTVTRLRTNLRPLIQGRRTNSALAIPQLFSFEDLDAQGNALNLGETVILQEEINPFISQLRMRGIEVTALHNHWLFDNPRLMYMHFKSVEPPLVFAQKVAAALRVLTTRTVFPARSCGSKGSRGTQGASGSNGSRGSRGSRGVSGSHGSRGSSGMNSSRGYWGSVGGGASRGSCGACSVRSAKTKAAKTKTANKKSLKSRSAGLRPRLSTSAKKIKRSK